jgi:hypothetical protein
MDVAREETLLRLAQHVADGRPIDWPAELTVHPSLAADLERLRQLEALARLHRSSAHLPSPPAAPHGPD